MGRFFIGASLLLNTLLLHAAMDQVDLIIFTHQQNQIVESTANLSTDLKNAPRITLKTNGSKDKPYQLLPASASQIRNEFWILNKKPQYSVLLNYSWLQPHSNVKAIAIPPVTHNGWEVSGVLRLQKDSFYSFAAELQFEPLTSSHSPFLLSQNQRLKEGVVYYLDHPQAGILVKVHPVS